jgi:hypothetical protein
MTGILTRHSNDMEFDQNISARLNTGIWRGGYTTDEYNEMNE